MIKVLLLSAGTNACYHISKVIKKNFINDFYIIGTDINDQYLIPNCNYIDKFYKVPYFSDDRYYNCIINICSENKIDYILPSFDTDQKLFYPENPKLLELGVKSLGVNKNTLNFYDNKLLMNEFLISKGFKIPRSFDIESIDNSKYYFIKPIDGVGSQGTDILSGLQIKKRGNSGILIQEKCLNPEITLECFYYKGIFRSIARERIATKSGVCTKTKIFNSKELNNIAYKFAKSLKTPYFFNLQFMKNSKNDYVITDVNLRLAGGMSLSSAAGWDEASAIAKIMLNKNEKEIFSSLPEYIQTQYVIRAYTDIVTKIKKQVIAFDLDGTLLDSRERHKIVLNDILKKYNLNINTNDLIKFKRKGKSNIDFLLSKGINKEKATQIQAEWIKHIEDDKYLLLDKLYPNTINLLDKSKDSDLILITARQKKSLLKKQLKRLNIKKYFKQIYVINAKTLIAEEKAKIIRKENIDLMFGDTENDKLACKIAGIKFIPCLNGFRTKKFLEKF